MSVMLLHPSHAAALAAYATKMWLTKDKQQRRMLCLPSCVMPSGARDPGQVSANIADLLITENIISFNHAYPNKANTTDHEVAQKLVQKARNIAKTYVNEPDIFAMAAGPSHPLSELDIIKMVDSFDYQCETETYQVSIAQSIITSLRHAALRQIEGYDDAINFMMDERFDGEVSLPEDASPEPAAQPSPT